VGEWWPQKGTKKGKKWDGELDGSGWPKKRKKEGISEAWISFKDIRTLPGVGE
jgi:hypothetical protein